LAAPWAEESVVRIVWDERNRWWGGGSHLAGGAPWRLLRLSSRARPVVQRLRAAGSDGIEPTTPLEVAVTRWLVARGLAHPRPTPRDDAPDDVVVIIPAHGRPELLDACLASLGSIPTVVVDDASPDPESILAVCRAHRATLVRHAVNRGPGAARNTGLAHSSAPVVAFLDSDCTVSPGWLTGLVPHLDDDRVGVVAPRVRPRATGDSLIARHEQTRSALDMGSRPELVTHGARLGFLPSAALVVRRTAIPAGGFDADMRVGEDVDLVWRMIDAGWLARYEPAVSVEHEMRVRPTEWLGRRFDYGTSAAALDRRHPGRLTPARLSGWNVAITVLATAGRPRLAVAVGVAAVAGLARGLGRSTRPDLAARVVSKGLVADLAATGHALRREWWPLGWLALLVAPRSRWGATAAATMLAPIALEYVRQRPPVDPARYAGLRLLEDAAYGSGVVVSALRGHRGGVLLPRIRVPGIPAAASAAARRWFRRRGTTGVSGGVRGRDEVGLAHAGPTGR
jgi:mycofactocin glycosyltransferase